MSSPQHWIAYRNLYFQEVVRFLEQTLDQAFRQYGFTGSLNRAPRFNLKAVENYWEFRSDDPVRLIYDLEPSFRSLGTSSRFRLYSGVITDLITSGHVPTLNFRVVEGVTAKLYAKTTKRVRLETVHDLRSSHRVDTSHTRADIAGIVELLEQVVTHDAREANVALETLEAQLTPYEGRQSSPYEFVRLVMLSAPDEDTQQALLSIIVNARGIRCGPNDPFRPAVDQLVRWGFLERSRPNSLSYRVAEEFAGACELLRGAV